MLRIRNLDVYYGAIHALKGVTIDVQQGEIVAIIGPNGAGKSTLLRTISGLLRPRAGQIEFKGVEIGAKAPHQIVQMGISHSPEGRRIFTNMTVLENLRLAAQVRTDDGIQEDIDKLLLRFPRLGERIKQSAGTLSGGEQQMLAICRALMSTPQLMLLDEPSLGLAPNLVKEIFKIVLEVNKTGTTVCLVEQNAHMALEIAHRAYVLETGSIVLTDTGANLLNNPKVRESYLGG